MESLLNIAVVIGFLIIGFVVYYIGIKLMSESSQKLFAKYIRKTLYRPYGNNIFKGFIICVLLQSSALFGKIVCNFANSNFFSTSKSTSLIAGANLGTCIKLIIIAILISTIGINYIIPSTFIALALYFMPFNSKIKNIWLLISGLMIIILGIEVSVELIKITIIENTFNEIAALYIPQSPISIIAVIIIAFLATIVMQSSSIVIIFIIILAYSNIITFAMSASAIIGTNLGSAILPVIFTQEFSDKAQTITGRNMLFNVVSTIICLSAFYIIDNIFSHFYTTDIAAATFQLTFNIITILSAELFKHIIHENTTKKDDTLIAYKKTGFIAAGETASVEIPFFTITFIQNIRKTLLLLPDLLIVKKEKKNIKLSKKFRKNIKKENKLYNDFLYVITYFEKKNLSSFTKTKNSFYKNIFEQLKETILISEHIAKIIEDKNENKIWFSQKMREDFNFYIYELDKSLYNICSNINNYEGYLSTFIDTKFHSLQFAETEDESIQAKEIFLKLEIQINKIANIIHNIENKIIPN